MDQKVHDLIEKLRKDRDEGSRKLGAVSYGTGKGKRNPIRDDTGPLLTGLVSIYQTVRRTTAGLHLKVRNILELGTAYGLSTVYLHLGAPEATVTTVEFDDSTAEEAASNFTKAGVDGNIVVICDDAENVIDGIGKKLPRPDVIFFDHEKSLYGKHFGGILERMEDKEFLLLADNVIDRKKECSDFLDGIKKAAHSFHIIETECGLLWATF